MKQKSIRQEFADTVLEVGKEDENLIVLIGDISHFILQPFAKACPGRFYNIGICEPTIVSIAAGLSKMGFYPVVHTISPFLVERSFEQIKLDFCYQRLGGNIITVGSAFDYSNLGCTHHCYGDFALFKTLQNVRLFYPSSAVEFKTLFRQAYNSDFLNYYRIPEALNDFNYSPKSIKIGKGYTIAEGSDTTLLVVGPHIKNALKAREIMAGKRSIEVIYLNTIRPLDKELIRSSIEKTKHVVVVEEHMLSGGLCDDVRRITSDMEHVRYASVCIPDKFINAYGTYNDHCKKLGFTPQGIVEKINETAVDPS
ncbi:MAG: transketolase C-terminal domain-containing protein [Thermodesulfobacteriota bacterium]|nr:transketolase C-terminal domain-containing protein [Thermodesulfobacteriota bacterium]